MKKDKIFIGLVVVDAILLVLNICDSVFGSMIRALFLCIHPMRQVLQSLEVPMVQPVFFLQEGLDRLWMVCWLR